MIEYPITIKNVLPDSKFYSLRDEFDHIGWKLDNRSYPTAQSGDKVSWMLNEPNNTLMMFECALIIKLKIQKYLKEDLVLIKIHSNGSTSAQTQKFHRDFDPPNIWTFILFTEEKWNTQWGGEFVCESNDGKYFYTPYIPNSGVLIPSEWEHYGSSPNVHTGYLRTTLAICYATPDSLPTLIDKYPDIVNRFL